MTIKLKGITWNHSRGYTPLVALAQRFSELYPEVSIQWEKRSLQQFADAPIQQLAEMFDLLVIDHPWAGFAANRNILLPLNQYLPDLFMANQEEFSVGKSHQSYSFEGKQVALAIDAAAPVASLRPDLFELHKLEVPRTWEDVVHLAATGKVAFAGIPIDTLMNFYMLCVSLGEEPFRTEERVIDIEVGVKALSMLAELTSLCSKQMFGWNPIAVYEAMANTNDIFYCPFAYGYSNYARQGYAKHVLSFTDLVSLGGHGPLRSTLGGTGISVSAGTLQRDWAVRFCEYVASESIQRTLYTECGGQPGHRNSWIDSRNNAGSGNYFMNTLPALERSYVRPRYDGYLYFQDRAGEIVHHFVQTRTNEKQTLASLNELYRASLKV